jgi:hypothetical protein
VELTRPWSRDFGARLWVAFSFLPDLSIFTNRSFTIQERELRRSLTGCAFVVMQTENHKNDCEFGQRRAQSFEAQEFENREFKTQGSDSQRFDIQAIGVETHKQHGEVAEARFLAKAASMGFGVAKPWGMSGMISSLIRGIASGGCR